MRTISILVPTCVVVAAIAVPSIAHANSVSYRCGSQPIQMVMDGDIPDDLNAAPNEVEVYFQCIDVDDGGGNIWSASGTIHAYYDKVAPRLAQLEVVDARWYSEGPNLVSDDFAVVHQHPTVPSAQTMFSVEGALTHPGPGDIDLVSLLLSVDILDVLNVWDNIGTFPAFVAMSEPDVAFDDTWPLTAHADSKAQRARFNFYLGIPNDAFELYDPGLLVVTEE
jgi:hypothetical protein